MRKYIVIAILAAVVSVGYILIANPTHSGNKDEHECVKCHKMTNDEALNILREAMPDVRILEINDSPIKGLWEVVLEGRGQKGIVYIDYSKSLLVSGGVFNIKTKTNLTADRLASLNKVDVSKIPLNDALLMGDKIADKKVIVFTDPD